MHRVTVTWPLMIDSFELTFNFESEYPSIDRALGVIKSKIFDDYTQSVSAQSDWDIQLEHAVECYNFAAEPDDEDENPCNINILDS